MIPPVNINEQGYFSICLNNALSNVLLVKPNTKQQPELNEGKMKTSIFTTSKF